MNRYLAPAPAQYDLGQQRQVAVARFGSVIDVNEVHNADGTRSVAVYLADNQPAAKITAWRSDVAATVYSPDPTSVSLAAISDWLDALIPQGENAVRNWATLTPLQKDAAAKQTVQAITRLARLLRSRLDSPGT